MKAFFAPLNLINQKSYFLFHIFFITLYHSLREWRVLYKSLGLKHLQLPGWPGGVSRSVSTTYKQ